MSDSTILSARTSPVNIGTDTHAARIAKTAATFQYCFFNFLLSISFSYLPVIYKIPFGGVSSVAQCMGRGAKDINLKVWSDRSTYLLIKSSLRVAAAILPSCYFRTLLLLRSVSGGTAKV